MVGPPAVKLAWVEFKGTVATMIGNQRVLDRSNGTDLSLVYLCGWPFLRVSRGDWVQHYPMIHVERFALE